MKAPIRRCIEVGMVIISILLSMAAIEIVFRVMDDPKPPVLHTGSYRSGEYFDRKDVPIGYRPGVGVFDSIKCQPDCKNGKLYEAIYTINEHHFRHTPEIPKQEELDLIDKNKKLLFVGGSFTFGEGVNDDETFPYFVSAKKPSWDVYNFGFHGYGVHQAVAQIQTGLFDDIVGEKADYVVLLTAPFHADRSYCLPFYQWGSPRYVLRHSKIELDGRCQDPRADWQHFMRKSYFLKSRFDFYPAHIDHNEKFDLYQHLIAELERLAHEKYGAKLIVAYMKSDVEEFHHSSYTNDKIMAWLQDHQIALFDATLGTSVYESPSKYRIQGDNHPTPLAHKARADLLINFIERLEKTN